MAKLEQAPIPTRPPETRPPLVVTVSPEKEDPRKDNKFSVLLKNVLNGYKEFVKNKTVLMKMVSNSLINAMVLSYACNLIV